ncbi:MAG: RNA methyltransferase [Candidatus Tectomicrobia bacterium]|uniref:RNA methyltransferase n=1 Tax=Tectimicrobiota bacterium TaxID=2528274 RepID=A0A933GPW4_UNCTE|nr:RNA methyltransferase [Candidatus Tectomicrobia bacterium]
MRKAIYLALLHYPVYDRQGKVITTSFTNLDIHDISRVAKTYDCKFFFLVTPVKSQREFAKRLINHWTEGFGSRYNPSRREALQVLSIKSDLKETLKNIEELEDGKTPIIIATGAKGNLANLDFLACRRMIHKGEKDQPILFLFGTGWGLASEVIQQADFVLEPIIGQGVYNHLSVRSAVAIVLDRLLGADGIKFVNLEEDKNECH